MSRSVPYLRRGLLGIAFVGSLGFAATAALAGPQTSPTARALVCPANAPIPCRCPGLPSCVAHPELCDCG